MATPVLVFDGDCGFCTTSARFLSRWVDGLSRYDVRPWQQLDLTSLGLTSQQCREAVQFVAADGEVSSGARAIAQALRRGGLGWRPLGLLIDLPAVRPVAARLYSWVADHRDRLPGGTPACAVSSSADAPSR